MKRNLTAILFVWLSACATTTPPRSLEQATASYAQIQQSDVASSQPKLVADGADALGQARQALKNGDYERADLLAQIASSKFGAAQNLIKHEEAATQASALTEASDGLADEEARVELERQALAHFLSVQDQFDAATAELQQYSGLEAQAREALAQARTAQSRAIASGAPTLAGNEYEQGRVLVESALQQLQSNGFEQSLDLSQQAIGVFDVAVSKSSESDVARRRERQAAETDSQKALQAKSKAQDAIDQASAERASAAASPNASSQGSFKKGEILLTQAQTALGDERYDSAFTAANNATVAFKSSKDTNPGLESAKTAISQAEDSRSVALGRGISEDNSSLRKGDFSLDLARSAFSGGDYPRALETAKAAKSAYEQTGATQAFANRSNGMVLNNQPQTGQPQTGQMLGNNLVVERVLKVQMLRAEALGQGLDRTCADHFREFEAVLQMAEARLAAGDHSNAFEFAIRAEERLKKCEIPSVAPLSMAPQTRTIAPQTKTDSPASTAVKAKATPADIKADLQQKEAAKSLATVQIQLAKLDSDSTLKNELAESRMLVKKAEEWFERDAYTESLQFSTIAKQKMTALETLQATAKKTPQALPAAAQTAQQATKDAPKVCATDDGFEALATSAKTRVFALKLSEEQANRAAEASRQIDAGKRLKEAGLCDDATLMFRGALRSFSDIETPGAANKSETPTKQTATKPTPQNVTPQNTQGQNTQGQLARTSDPAQATKTTEPKPSKGDRVAATDALATARRSRATLVGTDPTESTKVGESLFRQAETRFNDEQFDEATVLARQADAAFKGAVVTTDNTSWKADYDAVLAALVERDRAATVQSPSTKTIFDRGSDFLQKARGAWSQKDYQAAGTFAAAAKTDFDSVISTESKKGDEASKERAAKLAAQDAKAKKDQAELKKSAEGQASDAIRKAELSLSQCTDTCRSIAPEDVKRGELLLRDAKAALAAGDAEKANSLATDASSALDRAAAVRPTLQLPTGIELKGDRLLVKSKIEFETASDKIASNSFETLRALGQSLRENSTSYQTLTITGFTDSRGNDKKNLALSASRAESVKKALVAAGADASKLVAIGRGEEQPIASNDTADGRAENRRVEITIVLDSNTQVNP